MPRAHHHDYRMTSVYHITMTKAPGAPDLGRLTGGVAAPVIERSAVGRVVEGCIRRLPTLAEGLRLLQYALMPDHMHLLVHVQRRLPKALGSYLGMFKVAVRQELVRAGLGDMQLFEPDFYDAILYRSRPLAAVVEYIRQNPYRLAVRRSYPEYFSRVNNLRIGDAGVQAFGNVLLLRNPFMEQVVIHRRNTPAENARLREHWLYTAANGGVLVSPFISPAEKAIREEAEALGGKIILVRERPFGEREKPPAHDFGLCAAGRLLILALRDEEPGELTRARCLRMNELARLTCLTAARKRAQQAEGGPKLAD